MAITQERFDKAAQEIAKRIEEATDPQERQQHINNLATLKMEYKKFKNQEITPKDEAVEEIRNVAKTDPRGVTSAVLTGLTKGVLDTADLPFDLLNMVIDTASNLSGVRLPRTATPTQAIDYLSELATDTRVMEKLKTPSPEVDTAFERILMRGSEFGAGGATGAGVVRAGATRLADPNMAVRAGRQISPMQTTSGSIAANTGLVARESAAGTGAGLGFGATEEITDNPYAQFVGAMLGGTAPGAIYAGGRKAASSVSEGISSFTRKGAELRVGNTLVEGATDPGQAIQNITTNKTFIENVLPESQLSSTQLAADPGLARTIEAAIQNDRQLVNILEESTTRSVESLRSRLTELGDVGKPSQFVNTFNTLTRNEIATLSSEIDYAKNLLSKIEADRMSMRSGPEISEDFVQALETSYKNAKSKERQLWEAVDRTEPLNTKQLKRRVLTLRRRLKKEGVAIGKFPEDIFAKVMQFGRKNGPKTFGGLQNYRSEVLEDIRIANKANQASVANVLGELEKELRDVLSTSGSSDAHRAASEYTRVLHDNYNRGKLGRLLNVDSQGDLRIDPEIAAQSIIRTGDNIGDVKRSIALEREQVLESGETFPAASGLTPKLQEWLMAKFGGKETKAERERFIKQYQSTLNQFPELARDLRAISKQIDTLTQSIADKDGRIASLLDKKKTTAGALLGTRPDNAFNVLQKVNPDELENILSVAKREGVDEGLQAIYVRKLIDEMANSDNLKDVLGKLLRSNQGLKNGYEVVLTSQQRKSLADLQKAANLLSAKPSGKLPNNVESMFTAGLITELMARVAGVRAAGVVASGTSSLQAASLFSRAAKVLVNKMPSTHAAAVIEKAVVDPEYMKGLMKVALDSKGMTQKQIEERLMIYFSQAGVNIDEDERSAQ